MGPSLAQGEGPEGHLGRVSQADTGAARWMRFWQEAGRAHSGRQPRSRTPAPAPDPPGGSVAKAGWELV